MPGSIAAKHTSHQWYKFIFIIILQATSIPLVYFSCRYATCFTHFRFFFLLCLFFPVLYAVRFCLSKHKNPKLTVTAFQFFIISFALSLPFVSFWICSHFSLAPSQVFSNRLHQFCHGSIQSDQIDIISNVILIS